MMAANRTQPASGLTTAANCQVHGGKTKTFGKYWYFDSHMLNSLSFRGVTRSIPHRASRTPRSKKTGIGFAGVMNKVLDVHSQRFLPERIPIRSRRQSAPLAILNDGTGSVADDRVTTHLQSEQERGLPCAGGARDHDSRHAQVPSPAFATSD